MTTRPDLYPALSCSTKEPGCYKVPTGEDYKSYYCQYSLPNPGNIKNANDRKCSGQPNARPSLPSEFTTVTLCNGPTVSSDIMICNPNNLSTMGTYVPTYTYTKSPPSWYDPSQTFAANSTLDTSYYTAGKPYPSPSDNFGCLTACGSGDSCLLSAEYNNSMPVTIGLTPSTGYCDKNNIGLCKPGVYCPAGNPTYEYYSAPQYEYYTPPQYEYYNAPQYVGDSAVSGYTGTACTIDLVNSDVSCWPDQGGQAKCWMTCGDDQSGLCNYPSGITPPSINPPLGVCDTLHPCTFNGMTCNQQTVYEPYYYM